MLRNRLVVLALFGLVNALAFASDVICLAERGRPTVAKIVVGASPGPSEAYAAHELQSWIRQMTDVMLPIVTNAEISCGIRLESSNDASPSGDAFRLVAEGDVIHIQGGRRGVLYGSYELLERFGGIGWYASYVTVVPKLTRFVVPANLDVCESPAFEMRDNYFYDVLHHGDFAARLRLNGCYSALEACHGGRYGRCGARLRSHTFSRLLEGTRYIASHPEYFAMRNGRRIVSDRPDRDTQPCLTNPDVVRIMGDNFLVAIRSDPDAEWYGLTHNDNRVYCECPNCAAINAEEGSTAGTNVRFVNAIAERVAREFPDKLIRASAYEFTRHPPKTPYRANVFVGICPIECDCAHPIPSGWCAENALFERDLIAWKDKCRFLDVWNYVTAFRCFSQPFPNFGSLQADLRFYRDSGVKWFCPEGSYMSLGADLESLKAWMLAKWMWNPDADAETLLKNFFVGYYGAAAPYARAYFDALCACELPRGEKLTCFHMPRKERPVDDSFLEKAAGLWAAARKAVEKDPMRRRAVRLSAFGTDFVRYLRCKGEDAPRIFNVRRTSLADDPDYRRQQELLRPVADCLREEPDIVLQENKIRNREMTESLHRDIAGGGVPQPVVPCDEVIVSSTNFVLYTGDGTLSRRVDSFGALDGRAVELSDRSFEWCVQLALPKLAFDPNVKYRISVHAKVPVKESADPLSSVFEFGVNDAASGRRSVVAKVVARDAVSGWKWYDDVVFERDSSLMFWCAVGRFDKTVCRAHPCVGPILVDAIRIRRDGED